MGIARQLLLEEAARRKDCFCGTCGAHKVPVIVLPRPEKEYLRYICPICQGPHSVAEHAIEARDKASP